MTTSRTELNSSNMGAYIAGNKWLQKMGMQAWCEGCLERTRKVVRMLKCFFMSVPSTSSVMVQRHCSICSFDRPCTAASLHHSLCKVWKLFQEQCCDANWPRRPNRRSAQNSSADTHSNTEQCDSSGCCYAYAEQLIKKMLQASVLMCSN